MFFAQISYFQKNVLWEKDEKKPQNLSLFNFQFSPQTDAIEILY